MTITPELVKMIQSEAIIDLWFNYIFLSILISSLIGGAAYWIKVELDSTATIKPFIRLTLIILVVVLLSFFYSVYNTHLMWRDFPAQMILDKIL